MSTYPEHEKLTKIKDQGQACGEFVEWLREKGFVLAEYHKHTAECDSREDGWRKCGMTESHPYPASVNTPKLLAEFFEIDEKKLDAEKIAMLAELR